MNLSNNSATAELTAIYSTLNGASIVLCLLSTAMVFCFRLHRKVVYRLALYQVLSALMFTIVALLALIDVKFYQQDPSDYGPLCVALGWFNVYFRWVMLLFTIWITFHLFVFVVFHKNLLKLEVMYVVTSLLVPVMIAMVPVITNSYDTNGYCYMTMGDEVIGLWSAPALALILASSVVMVIIVAKLAHIVLRSRTRYEELTDGGQYWNALKQLLPLAAYPILFFIFLIPVLAINIYSYNNESTWSYVPILVLSLFLPLWSMSLGVTLVCHILLTQLYHKRTRFQRNPHIKNGNVQYSSCENTAKDSSHVDFNSATHFSLPNDSIGDCNDPTTHKELHV